MNQVILAAEAYDDLTRLQDWLIERDSRAAARFADQMADAIRSLSQMPSRGRLLDNGINRELVVRFGSAAYLIQYGVYPQAVVIIRILHSRERR